jgi:hypothetical protein
MAAFAGGWVGTLAHPASNNNSATTKNKRNLFIN